MLGTIKLNIIKNRVNDFELKSCVYITSTELISDKDNNNNNTLSFRPLCYVNNKAPFYILCSNKRVGTYNVHSFSPFTRNNVSCGNLLLDSCKDGINIAYIYSINLERLLIIQQNKEFLGWYPSNDLIDGNINVLKGNKNCKHHKDNIYYGDNKYIIDEDKLYLFVRIIPKDCTNLTNLLINCERDNIYNISERGYEDKVGTLGFIVKLDSRYEYVYNNVCEKITRIKYPFLTKDRINKLLFGGYEADYIIKKEIMYIKDSSKLDEYKINVLDSF